MNKELEAYDIVFNSFNNCTCQDGRFPIRSALDTIYQALKRNEPMKVDLETIVSISFGDFYNCPKCGEAVIGSYYNYCFYCGQKLDWSDDETEKEKE